MSAILAVLLSLGMAPIGGEAAPPSVDPAHLRELLQDRQHPQSQSQAALLLVQSRMPDAEAIVRQGLREVETPEQFLPLAAAVQLQHDARFVDELLAALKHGRPAIRQAAAEVPGRPARRRGRAPPSIARRGRSRGAGRTPGGDWSAGPMRADCRRGGPARRAFG